MIAPNFCALLKIALLYIKSYNYELFINHYFIFFRLIYNSKVMVALSTWSLRETTQSFMTASSSSEVTKAVRHTISMSAIFMKGKFSVNFE